MWKVIAEECRRAEVNALEAGVLIRRIIRIGAESRDLV
jgi:hypothetical protein